MKAEDNNIEGSHIGVGSSHIYTIYVNGRGGWFYPEDKIGEAKGYEEVSVTTTVERAVANYLDSKQPSRTP